jgi:acetyl-CoA carboxylase biotin carboxyl carrier protein
LIGEFFVPTISSPLSGRVVAISVKPGDQVTAGDPLLMIESMKMEIPVEAEAAGVVSQILLNEGDEVTEGQAIVVMA